MAAMGLRLRTRAKATTVWIAALATSMALSGCYGEHPMFFGTDVTGANWGKSFALIGHDGKLRTLTDFTGKTVVLLFCTAKGPNACRAKLSDIAHALEKLGRPPQVQVLFVSLDPDWATPPNLARYLRSFDPEFLGLHGDLDAIRRAATEFRIRFNGSEAAFRAEPTSNYGSRCFVIDSKGRIRLVLSNERMAEELIHDLRELMKEGS